MSRLLMSLLAVVALLAACAGWSPAAEPTIDEYVQIFNPDLLARVGDANHIERTSTFTHPESSDISTWVMENTWFSFIIFLPFLILPQVLLVHVMLKFRDRRDGRRPATFMHNVKLENLWTGIPILALVIVAFPVYPLLYKMELPPEDRDAMVVTVRGRQFAWDYEYKKEGVSLGLDLVSSIQEPLVLKKDKAVVLDITSSDVNHAWWVPAFGIKKDAIIGRFNRAWFTPRIAGPFRGQCAELCGQGHGVMIIGAVVAEPDVFDRWVELQRHRNDSQKVWDALIAWDLKGDDAPIRASVSEYLKKSDGDSRRWALQYWMAHNATSYTRRSPDRPQRGTKAEDIETYPARLEEWKSKLVPAWRDSLEALPDRRQRIDAIIAAMPMVAQIEIAAPPVAQADVALADVVSEETP
ncbi:MAG: cytochrome c oxidase subunit II [Planctomycetes bacterium]|nr:cytochrome c oxidase subunit II [Planctomycetota bacterium]